MLEAWYVGHLETPVTVTTPAELDAVLDEVAEADSRQVAQLIADGDVTMPDLTVGLFRDRGSLRYSNGKHEYFSKNGAFPLPDGWDELMYYLGNTEFFYPDDAEIPVEAARRAAHDFLQNSALPRSVEWSQEPSPVINPQTHANEN
ncbi:Imm1 family immunity protein [Amycolatopsis sp. cmx-8-4]|uniref:Imm1 family immunity protein n=1 Tax=Amycolatopsis sp. cmx-8-4 TaxID=2790947 RepID=UPI00397D7E73